MISSRNFISIFRLSWIPLSDLRQGAEVNIAQATSQLDALIDAPVHDAVAIAKADRKLVAWRDRRRDIEVRLFEVQIAASRMASLPAHSANSSSTLLPLHTPIVERSPPPSTLQPRAACAASVSLDDDISPTDHFAAPSMSAPVDPATEAAQLAAQTQAFTHDLQEHLSQSGLANAVKVVPVAARVFASHWSAHHRRWNELRAVESRLSTGSACRTVTLDVGGQKFTTTTATLGQEPSYLAGLFSGLFIVEPDRDGNFFIDRSPTWFGPILQYLRTREFPVNIAELDSTVRSWSFYTMEFVYSNLNFIAHIFWLPLHLARTGAS
jgi:hypothetical protein